MRLVPAFLPRVHVAEEGDGGRQIGLQMAQDVYLGILVVIGGEGGVEPQVGNDAGVNVLRIGRVVESGIHRGERADVPAGAAAAGDDALRINAELASVLLEPADGAFRVGDADALAGLTGWQCLGFGASEHAILRGGANEPATGKVGAGDAELPQRATAPATAVEEDHAGHFGFRRVVIGREVNLHLPRFPGALLVGVHFAGRGIRSHGGFLFRGGLCERRGGNKEKSNDELAHGDVGFWCAGMLQSRITGLCDCFADVSCRAPTRWKRVLKQESARETQVPCILSGPRAGRPAHAR